MPKALKNAAPKKPAGGAKKGKLYCMPEKIPEGTVLIDLLKQNWRVGPSIGIGGFGEIYTACKDGDRNYIYVVKCEPHDNGPLFVEMHFYYRNGKESDIQSYQKKNGLKTFGMPYMVGNGSVTLNGKGLHRFIVLPRYGRTVEYYFLANGRCLPIATVYRLAIQMLDVLEYIHQCGYIHADLKASNMLLGCGKNANAQAYLVDFGLASRFFIDREFKPDPKKAHNGTIEYTSRDAHQGVATLRSDFEILGYNLVQWAGAELPWVQNKLLASPVKVQAAKVEFMSNLDAELRKIFPESVPAPLANYLKYVVKLNHNDRPDYKQCKKFFQDALKTLKVSESGDLVLEITKKDKISSPKKVLKSKRGATKEIEDEVDSQERIASDDDDDDVVFEPKPKKRTVKTGTLKSIKVDKSPPKSASIPKKTSPKNVTPLRRRISPRSLSAVSSASPKQRSTKASPKTSAKKGTPLKARANINFSPAITLTHRSSSPARHGSTIINDNLTPNPRADKTYEFNFELDVSMDANVVVNVKRKKKIKTVASESSLASKSSPRTGSALTNGSSETPVKRVRVEKVSHSTDENKSSPRTPAVTVKKVKRVISPR